MLIKDDSILLTSLFNHNYPSSSARPCSAVGTDV